MIKCLLSLVRPSVNCDGLVNAVIIRLIEQTNNDEIYWAFNRRISGLFVNELVYRAYHSKFMAANSIRVSFMYPLYCYMLFDSNKVYPSRSLSRKLYKGILKNIVRRDIINDEFDRIDECDLNYCPQCGTPVAIPIQTLPKCVAGSEE